jgi:hypothetical protein
MNDVNLSRALKGKNSEFEKDFFVEIYHATKKRAKGLRLEALCNAESTLILTSGPRNDVDILMPDRGLSKYRESMCSTSQE